MPATSTTFLPHHVAVIPCRWGASRFPGKPLAPLGDKPLLWHVYQRCLEAHTIAEAVVATDDHRIYTACRELGIRCLMTGEHATGTDRVAECAQQLDADAIINVQGDEPFISPNSIDAVSFSLADAVSNVSVVNACAELHTPAAVTDHNVVKTVTTTSGNALMFSRQPIPYPRDDYPTYLRQLGLYGFTPEALRTFRSLPQGPLERAEAVEMLRFLEHGHSVRTVIVADGSIAVDTPDDLRRAGQLLKSTSGADRRSDSAGRVGPAGSRMRAREMAPGLPSLPGMPTGPGQLEIEQPTRPVHEIHQHQPETLSHQCEPSS